jgi:hypothetical protein
MVARTTQSTMRKVTDVWVRHPSSFSFRSLTFGSIIQSLSFLALDHKCGTWNFEFTTPPSGPPHLYIKQREKPGLPIPLGNFPKLGDLLLDRRRDLVDLWRKQQWATDDGLLCYERRPSSSTSGSLPWQHPWRCKMVQTRCSVSSLEAHPGGRRSTTVGQNIMLKAQGRAAKSRRHSKPSSLPIRQVCGLLPVLIDSIRLLSHALWLYILFFHVWVIVDLHPIARVCSKSFYLSFVEICCWNYWTASPCSLPLNIVVACFCDCASSVPYCKRLFQVNLFEVCRN